MDIKVNKAGISYTFDFSALADNVKEYVIEYGLRQIMNDSVSAAKEEEAAKELADKKFAALLSGEIRAMREGGRITPEEKFVREMVAEKLVKVGLNKTDAAKTAKDPEHAMRIVLAKALSAKHGKPFRVDSPEVTEKLEVNLNSIRAKAKTLAAALAKGSLEIDI